MILRQIQRLEQTSSRNDKIAIVQQLIEQDPIYIRLFRDALDPLFNYGIKKLPRVEEHNGSIDFTTALNHIEQLRRLHHSNELLDKVATILTNCNADDAVVIGRILLKDLRCGVQIATVNKAVANLNKTRDQQLEPIFDYPCMLTSAYSQKLSDKLFANSNFLFCQQKCDGMRFNAVIDENRNVHFYGRSGKEIYINDQRFYQLFEQFDPCTVVDGELLIDGKQDGSAVDRKTGNGILNKAVKGTITPQESKRITATLWDVIPLDCFRKGIDTTPYQQRFATLNQYFERVDSDQRLFVVETNKITSYDQAIAMFNHMIEQGKEGVIVKSPTSIWKNVRSTECMKLKDEKECDLLVTNWTQITNGTQRMGSLSCVSADGLLKVDVGSGFTDQERLDFFQNPPVDKIITVKFNALIQDEKTKVYSLFLPRFVEVRYDKANADSLQTIKMM